MMRKQRRDDVKESFTPEERDRHKRAREQQYIDSLTPGRKDDFLKRKKAEDAARQKSEDDKRRTQEAWQLSQRPKR